MKKLIAFALILTFAVALVSCATQTTPEATTYNYYTSKITPIVTTATTATTAATTVTVVTTGTAKPLDVTVHEDEHGNVIIGEYTNENISDFIRFAEYASRYRMSANEPYLPNNPVKNITDWFHDDNITFTIAGYTGKSDPTLIGPDYSYFYVYAKGIDEDHFSDKVYKIRLNGTPSIPCYGVPRVKLGKTYFRYRTAFEAGDDLNTYSDTGFLMCGSAFGEVVEIDGIEWLYPNKLFGFEDFADVVEITDDYENQIYKPGEDDDIIEYLKKNNIPIPTYGYKIKLSDFIADFIAEMCN